jgi:hypothetical protein
MHPFRSELASAHQPADLVSPTAKSAKVILLVTAGVFAMSALEAVHLHPMIRK